MNFSIPKKYAVKAAQFRSKEEKVSSKMSMKLPKLEFESDDEWEEKESR